MGLEEQFLCPVILIKVEVIYAIHHGPNFKYIIRIVVSCMH